MSNLDFYLAHYYDDSKKQYIPFCYTNFTKNIYRSPDDDGTLEDSLSDIEQNIKDSQAELENLSEKLNETGNVSDLISAAQATANNAAAAAAAAQIAADNAAAIAAAAQTAASNAANAASSAQTAASNAANAASSAQTAASNSQNTANAALSKSGGTATGAIVAGGSLAIGTKQVRNITISTTDLTAGSSTLATGDIYLVYE